MVILGEKTKLLSLRSPGTELFRSGQLYSADGPNKVGHLALTLGRLLTVAVD